MEIKKPIYRLQSIAIQKVSKAIKAGILRKLDGSIKCVDCGKIAVHYDHRDYRKPLKVDPVCAYCNHHRYEASDIKKYRTESGIFYDSTKHIFCQSKRFKKGFSPKSRRD